MVKESALARSKQAQPSTDADSIDQRDATRRFFEKKAELAKTLVAQKFWQLMATNQKKHEVSIDAVFADIQKQLNPPPRTSGPNNYNCLRALMGTVHESCGFLRDYGGKYVKTLVAVCESRTLEESITAVQKACDAHGGFYDFDRNVNPPAEELLVV